MIFKATYPSSVIRSAVLVVTHALSSMKPVIGCEPVNHTSWVALVTPTDRPKSVRNRCLIELFCGVVCVVTLPF